MIWNRGVPHINTQITNMPFLPLAPSERENRGRPKRRCPQQDSKLPCLRGSCPLETQNTRKTDEVRHNTPEGFLYCSHISYQRKNLRMKKCPLIFSKNGSLLHEGRKQKQKAKQRVCRHTDKYEKGEERRPSSFPLSTSFSASSLRLTGAVFPILFSILSQHRKNVNKL